MSNGASNSKKNRTGLIVGIVVGIGLMCFLSVFSVYYFILRRRKANANKDEGNRKAFVGFIFYCPDLNFSTHSDVMSWCWGIDAHIKHLTSSDTFMLSLFSFNYHFKY